MSAVPEEPRAAAHADAARTLYERYSNRIFRYCLQRLRSVEEAEDAAQTAFLYAFLGLQRGVQPEFEVAWLYKIAENVCRTRLRASARRGRHEAVGDLLGLIDLVPAAQPSREDDKVHALPEILSRMPASQRRALLLREVQGLSYREIANQLRTSVSAVETLLFRARRSCARELDRLGQPAEKLLSVATLASVLRSLWSRYAAASGGMKAATVAAAVAAGGVAAVTPQVAHEVAEARAAAAAPRPRAVSPPAPAAGARSATPKRRPPNTRDVQAGTRRGSANARRPRAQAPAATTSGADAETPPVESPQPSPGISPPPPPATSPQPPAPKPAAEPAAAAPQPPSPSAPAEKPATPTLPTPSTQELPVSVPSTPTLPAPPVAVPPPPQLPTAPALPATPPAELPSVP